jgi:hypothetical protein
VGLLPDTVRRVEYYYITLSDRPGEGVRALQALKDAGVNLIAVHGFPAARRSQIDLVPSDAAALKAAASRAKWKLTGPKKAFLIEGDDRTGALVDYFAKLAGAKINITAISAVTAGSGRFGAILWVKQRDAARAAKALGAG